jgi:hypothetical protein
MPAGPTTTILKAVKRTQLALIARGAAIVVVIISMVITAAIVFSIHLMRINGLLAQYETEQPNAQVRTYVSAGIHLLHHETHSLRR